ncbi:FIT family protein-like protein [Leptotrombidium deliense]|uniref:FIT family protein-like protein n=1 Tax=Leptotrombidium deliense TaxID=299467 RepID=A0A443SHX5_9ACAR|nr:FIT family protein-like protein [Leptotrombidium deliense]
MVNQKTNSANLLKFRRKSEKMTPLEENSPEQRYLTTSTSLGHVLMMIILNFCRRITCGTDVKRRLLFYFCVIVFGGIVADFAPPIVRAFMPIKIMKGNILNQWFVKIGWFWTLVLVTPFVAMTSEILRLNVPTNENETKNNTSIKSNNTTTSEVKSRKDYILQLAREKLKKDLIRVVVATVMWWSFTTFFEWFDNYTASCSISSHKTRVACLNVGARWTGFDISGHTFILLFSNLIILEECAAMIGWEPFGNQLNAMQQHYQKVYGQDYEQHVIYSRYIVPIRIFFLTLTVLTLLWDFMLIQTALFYHTMIQKFVAFVIAASLWYLLYRIVYKYFNISVVQIGSR